jgi:UrcA family protein
MAIAAFIGTIGTAAAQPAEGDRIVRRDVVVGYHDLNLSEARDAAILLDRLSRAAEQACGGRPFSFYELDDTHLRQEYHRCHADALARAVEKVGAPLVKQLLAQAD